MKSYGEFYKNIVSGSKSKFLHKVNSAYFNNQEEPSGAKYSRPITSSMMFRNEL